MFINLLTIFILINGSIQLIDSIAIDTVHKVVDVPCRDTIALDCIAMKSAGFCSSPYVAIHDCPVTCGHC
ncbi:unnamed protein product [Cylicocyclus nassatus]|uniref:ShKT domain-containing protein n=1 Tax=Cylicocyclus nassatus TaxID=53992 RepID=A0AA36GNQ3_CYLNA|nr:unnamed protein product [Cylicocyclus nassatus]